MDESNLQIYQRNQKVIITMHFYKSSATYTDGKSEAVKIKICEKLHTIILPNYANVGYLRVSQILLHYLFIF